MTTTAEFAEQTTVIDSNVIVLVMLSVGVLLTLALLGFFGVMLWRESRGSGNDSQCPSNHTDVY